MEVKQSTTSDDIGLEEARAFLQEHQDFLNRYRKGVYASCTLEPQALGKVWRHLKSLGLPLQEINKAHITVVYSRTRPGIEPEAIDITGEVQPTGFGIFGKGSKDEPYVLVLKVRSKTIQKAREQYLRNYSLKPTYRDFEPHITLTYDINRIMPGIKKMSPRQKQTITNIFDTLIPELPKTIRILRSTIEPI